MNETFEQIWAIAVTTYRESIRSKVLYSIMFFALLLVTLSAFFGTVTIGDHIKVIKDFGLFSVSLFTVAFAVISGSNLLAKELSKKTVYNILGKPVARWQFLAGKYFGMLGTSLVLLLLMGVGLTLFVALFEGGIDWKLWQGFYFMGLELAIVCAAAIFFSTLVVTPMLGGLFTFCTFLAGRAIGYLLTFVEDGTVSGALAWSLEALHAGLPQLNKLYIGNELVYGIVQPLPAVVWATVYSFGYAGLLITVASILFQRREFY